MSMSAGEFEAIMQRMAEALKTAVTEAVGAKISAHDGGMNKGRRILDPKGYDGVETFAGGEEGWSNWKFKVAVATKPMSEELVELLEEAELGPKRSFKEVVDAKYDEFVPDEVVGRMKKASSEFYAFLVRTTSGEAALVVKQVESLDGVEAYGKLHERYSRKTMGRMFRLQRECMYPKEVKKWEEVVAAIMQWENKWRKMMAEIGKDMKIPDMWRMSALLNIVPIRVQDEMIMRLEEDTSYQDLKEKILRYAVNKVEQVKSGGGTVPMDVDEVDEHDADCWDDGLFQGQEIAAVWPTTQCYNCKGHGHMARNCPNKGGGKGGKGGKGFGKDGKNGQGFGKADGKGFGKSNKGDVGKAAGKGKGFGYQGTCFRCGQVGHKQAECNVKVAWHVEEQGAADEVTAEEMVWSVAGVDEIEEGPPPSVPPGLRRLGEWPLRKTGKSQREQKLEKARQWAACGKGCKHLIAAVELVTDEVKVQNKYDALMVEDGEVMVNGVENEGEIDECVEVTIDSGASRSVWPRKKCGVQRTKSKKTVKLAAANGSPIEVDGDALLQFERGGRRCAMRFLDADVKRPLGAVSAIVDEGNDVIFSAKGSYIENCETKERIPMIRKNGVFVIQLEALHGEKKKPNDRQNHMEVDEVLKKDGLVFMGRMDEEDMGVFRRRA